MPRILVIADLHHDHWLGVGRDPFAGADFTGVDLVILAGDVANRADARWPRALGAITDLVAPEKVQVVPGNHDYYSSFLDRDDLLAELAANAGAGFAQRAELRLGTRRIICCTLWTDMQISALMPDTARRVAEDHMGDYRYIRLERDDHRRITALDTVAVHVEHRTWLEARLATPFDGQTIVITHHAPHPMCLPDKPFLPQAYASDLSNTIETFQPALWIYGHTHHPASFHVGRTEVRNVSFGYPGQFYPAPKIDRTFAGFIEWSDDEDKAF